MSKKVGSVVRPSNSGLGNLAWDFYRHGLIDKCLLQPSVKGDYFPERFGKDTRPVEFHLLTDADMEWLLSDIQVLLLFETAFNNKLIDKAKERGIKTILMPMHEGEAGWRGQEPDIVLCPSDLEYELPIKGKKIRINVPVDTKVLPQRLRRKARVFVHNVGHGGMMFRNGTPELLKALELTKSDFKLILRSQTLTFDVKDPRVDYQYVNYENYWDIWRDGDVLIWPDKFSGLSMPLQEAFASGFGIMATNHPPINKWLPRDMLFEAANFNTTYRSFHIAEISPNQIARMIDEWVDKDITHLSRAGLKWAEENSWEKLLPKYKEICEK